MNTSKLFSPLNFGAFELPHRVVMAPMTRSRSTQPGNVPNDMMATYYAQRASAGFIVSEATQISPQGQGYSFTPGIHSLEQVAGWRGVTNAVHAAGGRMALQLWHVGRMSHASFQGGGAPVAPSAIAPDAKVWIVDANGQGGMVDCPVPRALEVSEIQAILEDYALAAQNAKDAGFDGVEIHAANGYLIDSFLRSSSNQRTDAYGGSNDKRLRFFEEVVDAVVSVMGAARVGVRMSPHITQRGMNCPEMIETTLQAAKLLSDKGVAYLHFAEADWDDAPEVPESFRRDVRAAFKGAIGVAGGYTLEKAQAVIDAGFADWVAFGRPFIGNPDLPKRLRHNIALTSPDTSTLFGGDARGYFDYAPAQ
ncbi:alkene reductase [Variovorax sp. PCZ-1]|uniref:alkene reductase n=1 Tax=Variovorax sp. PCZ-1 TaxID=2835533 RepID=UPI001BCC1B29|nr:alkene reductase [Variovorax sp. PCZ-1]MBS7809014.1 alkene reductase [Variovorax sp. PCZ-1]